MSDLFKDRAAAKARACERDEERLRRGEITPSQLQKKNASPGASKRARSACRRNTGGRSSCGQRMLGMTPRTIDTQQQCH